MAGYTSSSASARSNTTNLAALAALFTSPYAWQIAAQGLEPDTRIEGADVLEDIQGGVEILLNALTDTPATAGLFHEGKADLLEIEILDALPPEIAAGLERAAATAGLPVGRFMLLLLSVTGLTVARWMAGHDAERLEMHAVYRRVMDGDSAPVAVANR